MQIINIIDNKDGNKLIKVLVAITVMLIVLNIINEVFNYPSWQINRLINADYESNFTTWFTSLIWAIAAYMAYICYKLSREKGLSSRVWIALSLALLFLSCDEVAMMHEKFGEFGNKYFLKLNLLVGWPIVLAPLIIPALLFFFIALYVHLKHSKKAWKLLLTGAGLFVFGAIVLELCGNFKICSQTTMLYKVEVLFEESFEMFGAIFITMGLIKHRQFLKEKWQH